MVTVTVRISQGRKKFIEMEKKECIGHVQKRVGNALGKQISFHTY